MVHGTVGAAQVLRKLHIDPVRRASFDADKVCFRPLVQVAPGGGLGQSCQFAVCFQGDIGVAFQIRLEELQPFFFRMHLGIP